jgi:dTDP-4-amino-4,6-dideoxygalactose transaminase
MTKPIDDGWVVQGPRVREFEEKFCAFSGAAASVATTSCTTALHLAAAVLGLKAGDEVIVPAFTWVATANIVESSGATPVFCDIDLHTYNLDVDQMVRLIGPRTVGIIPVHLFGLCADMDRILPIARDRGLWLIEDAACGFGARIRGRHAGTFGDLGCFSFHPRKAITTGEGGMITTMTPALAQQSRSVRDHGVDLAGPSGRAAWLLPDYPVVGYNYRMTDIQGALGASQLDRASVILAKKRSQVDLYDRLLGDLPELQRPTVPQGYDHGYQSYVCLVRPEPPTLGNVGALTARRDALMAHLDERGIGARQGTHAAALTGYYRNKYKIHPEHVPNAYLAERLTVALPLYHELTESEITEVSNAVHDALSG